MNNNFLLHTEEKGIKIFNNLSNRLDRKFEILMKNHEKNTSKNLDNKKWIKNLSDIQIPENVIDVVSLGPNYNVREKLTKSDLVLTVKNLEYSLRKIEDGHTIKNNIRESVTNALINEMGKVRHISSQDREFSKKLVDMNNFLKQNSNVFFTRADKGNLTVCMNKTDYVNKMNALLDDKRTYKIVKRNLLDRYNRKSTKFYLI